MSKAEIKPFAGFVASYREHGLKDVDEKTIEEALGFPPNQSDDADKVTASWAFTVDGELCAVWDYKGSFLIKRASAFGPKNALMKVFGDKVV